MTTHVVTPDSVEVSPKSVWQTGSNDEKCIDLKSLNPDTNGDGKVSASEEKIYKLLTSADKDGSGYLSVPELYIALEKFAQVQKSRTMFKRAAAVLAIIVVVQVALTVGLVAAFMTATKDQYAKGSALTTREGTILSTVEATMKLPLLTIPVLPVEQKESLRVMTVSYEKPNAWPLDMDNTTLIKESVVVNSVMVFNETVAELAISPTHLGQVRSIRIFNGDATIRTEGAGKVSEASLCFNDISCSSFSVDKEAGTQLMKKAEAALKIAGVELDETAAPGRRLRSCPCGFRRRRGSCVPIGNMG